MFQCDFVDELSLGFIVWDLKTVVRLGLSFGRSFGGMICVWKKQLLCVITQRICFSGYAFPLIQSLSYNI
jgi:hypothetical protein